MSRRKYWLKLREDYFQSPKIKKLRSVAGGDRYALIYLEMQCYSIRNEGIIIYEGLEKTLAEELALILNENPTDVEFLLGYLEKYKLIECIEDDQFLLPEAAMAIGSETEVAERVRKSRAKKKQEQISQQEAKLLQCNTEVTETKQPVTNCNDNKNNIYNKNTEQEIYNNIKSQIQKFIDENSLIYVNADEFFSYYQQRGWKTNAGVKITNWQALLQNWNKRAKAVHDERQREQQKLIEKHGYFADNGKVQSEPLESPVATAETATSFADFLKQNGKESRKASQIAKDFIKSLAKEKEVKTNV